MRRVVLCITSNKKVLSAPDISLNGNRVDTKSFVYPIVAAQMSINCFRHSYENYIQVYTDSSSTDPSSTSAFLISPQTIEQAFRLSQGSFSTSGIKKIGSFICSYCKPEIVVTTCLSIRYPIASPVF